MSGMDYAAIATKAAALSPGKSLKVGRVSNITVFRRYVAKAGVTPDLFYVCTVSGVCFIKRRSKRIQGVKNVSLSPVPA